MTPDRRAFIVSCPRGTRAEWIARVVGLDVVEVRRLRSLVSPPPAPRLVFAELFARYHGRPPQDEEWPAPRRIGAGYEWLAPELALLASLVGRVGTQQIVATLTARLRLLTGDATAARDANTVGLARGRLGLITSDVVGGLSIKDAAREIGSSALLHHEIRLKRIRTVRVGRLHVIPRAVFDTWKATRVFPPAGFIPLAPLKKALGIRSDKLSEWARLGYVPSARRCCPYGVGVRSTKFGTWWIDPKVARKLLADRRAGRPMPWWGQPEPYNLKATYRLWQTRQHPAPCDECRAIWGAAGVPSTFEDYQQRYPPLSHGAKRHLTRVWTPGLRLAEVATSTGASHSTVQRAVATGVLRSRTIGRTRYVMRTDATRWKARHCPTGDREHCWVAFESATKVYGFSRVELQAFVDEGTLAHRLGDFGAQRGIDYVLRQQCRELRDRLGYGEADAARRVGVSVARLRILMRGLGWRPSERIHAEVINAAIKRQQSRCGLTLSEAAAHVAKPVAWIRQQILAGVFRPLRTKWDRRRLYVSGPQLKRLEAMAKAPVRRERWSRDWLKLSPAAHLAGVSTATLIKWAAASQLIRRQSPSGQRYHRASVERRAREYWATVRFRRATPPLWLSVAVSA